MFVILFGRLFFSPHFFLFWGNNLRSDSARSALNLLGNRAEQNYTERTPGCVTFPFVCRSEKSTAGQELKQRDGAQAVQRWSCGLSLRKWRRKAGRPPSWHADKLLIWLSVFVYFSSPLMVFSLLLVPFQHHHWDKTEWRSFSSVFMAQSVYEVCVFTNSCFAYFCFSLGALQHNVCEGRRWLGGKITGSKAQFESVYVHFILSCKRQDLAVKVKHIWWICPQMVILTKRTLQQVRIQSAVWHQSHSLVSDALRWNGANNNAKHITGPKLYGQCFSARCWVIILN